MRNKQNTMQVINGEGLQTWACDAHAGSLQRR